MLRMIALLSVSALGLSGCGAWHIGMAPLSPVHASAQCASVEGIPDWAGVEDVALDPASSGAFVSVADWSRADSPSPRPGGLYFVALDDSGRPRAENRTPPGMSPIFPHGLDLWRSSGRSTGSGRLFVVNHVSGSGPSRIDIFDVSSDGRLAWSDDSPGPLAELHRPNDVVAAGPLAFYASNDHASPKIRWFSPGLSALLEDAVGLRSGAVVYVDLGTGRRTTVAAAFPNGMEINGSGEMLFVSESARAGVRTFRRDPASGDLRPAGRLRAGRLPDNLAVEDDRYLWVAVHDNGFRFARHALATSRGETQPPLSPGRILRFDMNAPEAPPLVMYAPALDEIARGEAPSAVSAAAPFGAGFLIASIFEGLYFCQR